MAKPTISELRDKVAIILHDNWDPIGVSEIPEAHDEYDAYVPKVVDLVLGTTDGSDVATYLSWVATERMGLSPNTAHDLEIAKLLLAAREAST